AAYTSIRYIPTRINNPLHTLISQIIILFISRRPPSSTLFPYTTLFRSWLKLVKDFLKVRCRLALLPFLISCLIWLDLVASPTKSSNLSETAEVPRSEERFSRNAETELVCRLLLEKKKVPNPRVYQEYNSFQ